MFLILLLLLTVVPLVELMILIRLYHATDLITTLAVVIVTGIVGAALARRQGWETWRRIQTQLSQGKPPTTELLDGLMIVIAGALLITPGILTDLAGFSLLIPPVRTLLRGWLARRLVPPGMMQFHSFTTSHFGQNHRPNENEIEAEYTVEQGHTGNQDHRLPKSSD